MHQSNFRVVGFTERPRLRELARLAARRRLPLIDDLGSGALLASTSLVLGDEPTAAAASPKARISSASPGDKLLGGPQAGIVVGRAELVERLRRHPLQRALRADKLTLAALEGTLGSISTRSARGASCLRCACWTSPPRPCAARAERLAGLVGGTVEETVATVGGGALPLVELPSFAVAVEEELAAALRAGDPPVVALVRDGSLPARLPDAVRRRGRRGRRRSARCTRVTGTSPDGQIWNLLHGAIATRVLAIVTDLGISDRLEAGPRPVAELALESGADEDTLLRFLRALASDGVFAEERPGVFRNTRPPTCCAAPSASSRISSAASGTARSASSTPPGRPTFERLHGVGFWEWLAERPDERATFDRRWSTGSGRRVDRLDVVAWRGDETVVDVGGGNGSLLLALLERQPGLRGIVFDLPETVRDKRAGRPLRRSSSGSFFERCRPGDVYVLSTVIHDWDDERATAILRTIRAAARRRLDACCSSSAVVADRQRAGRRASGSTC